MPVIPTCHGCNSSIKGVKNPLSFTSDEFGIGRIYVSALPYAETAISNNTYLKVELGKGATVPITIKGLMVRKQATEEAQASLRAAMQVLEKVYKIPGRWSGKNKDQEFDEFSTTDRISETLFRRMRQFLSDNPDIRRNTGILQSSSTALEIYNTLKFLLYYLDKEDRQRDPFAFALTWMLATLIEEDIKPELPLSGNATNKQEEQKSALKNVRGKALLEEINAWFGPDLAKQQERDQHTDKLLSILQNQKDSIS